MNQLEIELEEERNNSDLLSERITRSREQVLYVMGGEWMVLREKGNVRSHPRIQRRRGGKSMPCGSDGGCIAIPTASPPREVSYVTHAAKWEFPEWLWTTVC